MSEFEALNAANSEAQEKMWLSRLFAQTGVLAATGVLDGLVVTQAATANGTVLIASGSAVVQPTMTAGASLLVNDTQKTLDIFTANPMGGLARNDIVEFDSLTALISVRVGEPNATPDDPTVPNTSVALARLRHIAGATAIDTAHIDTLIVATMLRLGVHVHKDAATGGVLPYTAAGSTIATPNGVGNVAIVYGVTFTAAVWAVANTADGASVVVTTLTGTTTGATVRLFDGATGAPLTTGSRRVNWSATGTLA